MGRGLSLVIDDDSNDCYSFYLHPVHKLPRMTSLPTDCTRSQLLPSSRNNAQPARSEGAKGVGSKEKGGETRSRVHTEGS